MVEGRRNFGPAPKHKSGEVKEPARKSATEAASERISATRGGTPRERSGASELKRRFEAEHDGNQRRAGRRQTRKRERS
jgi:hypothetical protein